MKVFKILAACALTGFIHSSSGEELMIIPVVRAEYVNLNSELEKVSRRNMRDEIFRRPYCSAPRHFRKRIYSQQNQELSADVRAEWYQNKRSLQLELQRRKAEAAAKDNKSATFFRLPLMPSFSKGGQLPKNSESKQSKAIQHDDKLRAVSTSSVSSEENLPLLQPLSREEVNDLNNQLIPLQK